MEDEGSSSEYKLTDYGSSFSSILGKKLTKKMKIIISLTIIGVMIVIVGLVILIINLSKSNDDNENKEEDDEDKEDYSNYKLIGQINCTYQIETTSKKTQIIGEEYKKESIFQMIIDDKTIKFKKEYKFPSIGKHYMTLNIYEDISLQN